MKKLFVTSLILCICTGVKAQSELTFYTDSSHTHGFILLNEEQPFSSQKDLKNKIDSFNIASGKVWKLPTHHDMKFIYSKTYDTRLRRSYLFTGIYFIEQTVTDDQGGFLGYYECKFIGSNFTYSPPAYDFTGNLRHRRYLLIKPF